MGLRSPRHIVEASGNRHFFLEASCGDFELEADERLLRMLFRRLLLNNERPQ